MKCFFFIFAIQGKETVRVKDSSDDLWFVEEDQISVHIDTDDTFSVEYEVESDRESDFITELSEISSDGSEVSPHRIKKFPL